MGLGSALSIRRWSRHVEANFAVLKECISRQNGARSPFCESYKIYNGRGENFSIASLFFILHIDMNLRHFSYRSTIIAILSVPRSLIAYCFSISIYMYTYIFKIYSYIFVRWLGEFFFVHFQNSTQVMPNKRRSIRRMKSDFRMTLPCVTQV